MRSICPAKISGRVTAPASKSLSIRALLAAALAPGTSIISNISKCDDLESAKKALLDLGVPLRQDGTTLTVKGGAIRPPAVINCGESALLLRMLIPITALFIDAEIKLTAKGTLLKRPIGDLDQLQALGVAVSSVSGKPPLLVKGKLAAGAIALDASHTSQIVSGLLFALPILAAGSRIKLERVKSRPYLELSLGILKQFGINWEVDWEEMVLACDGGQAFHPQAIEIEGDWSAAAFWLVAGALSGEVRVSGLNPNSLQADRAILELLKTAGVSLQMANGEVGVRKSEIRGFNFDLSESPDLFPAAACLAAGASGESLISGVSRLKNKESDRAEALVSEFGKLGVRIELEGEVMRVRPATVKAAKLDAHADHRIAMACAIAALNADAEVEIVGAECVSKSYPDFFEHLDILRT